MCDVPSHDNSPPLDVSKDQLEDLSESNEEFSSTDGDSFSIDDNDYVDTSPPDSELVSLEIAELKENFNGMSIEIRKKQKLLQQEQWAYLSTHPSKCLTSFCYDDDDEDYTSAITPEPVLSTGEPDNSLSMGDEHLDTKRIHKDSDSLIEEIDLFCTPDYQMPPGIEDKDYDSKRDILIPKDLPSNNTLSFAEK
nr:hypothetical protein [Tanacetum cinerariifolium]